MTASELRALAAAIGETQYPAIRGATHEQRQQVAGYLRACADALEAGPVAFVSSYQDGMRFLHWIETQAEEFATTRGGRYAPLYPLAMPAPLRLPEPMADAEVFASTDQYRHQFSAYDLARAIEVEVLRRVKEANE